MEEKSITKDSVYQAVEAKIKDTDMFIVSVLVTPASQIVVEIDADNGVSIEKCIDISRYLSATFGETMDDYELEVTSASMSQPFKILRQYKKYLGKEVEVLSAKGIKMTGLLSDVNDENFTIQVTKKEKLPGAKRKTEVTEDVTFNYNEIKYTKYNFRF